MREKIVRDVLMKKASSDLTVLVHYGYLGFVHGETQCIVGIGQNPDVLKAFKVTVKVSVCVISRDRVYFHSVN